MAKRKGGSGFIYASLPLDMTQTLHELEEERPGTVSALILAYMDYAQDHAKEETVPEIVPEAPEGFSLAAKQNWRRLIQIYHGARGSYLAQVEGGKKAQPGPGRPKGSKNKPRESADTDTGSEAAEDREEPGQSAEAAADDIRITGKGPWLPSESDLKKEFWAAMISDGHGESCHATANAIASNVWARLQNCDGYLAPNGYAGIDKRDVPRLLQALVPGYYDDADGVAAQAAHFWTLLDAWARYDKGKMYFASDYLMDLFMDNAIQYSTKSGWRWKDDATNKWHLFPSGIIDAINEDYKAYLVDIGDLDAQEQDAAESTDQPDAQDTDQDTPENEW